MSQFKKLSEDAILSQLFEDDDGLDELDPQGNDCVADSEDEEPQVPDKILLGDGDEDEPVSEAAELLPILTPPPPSPGSQDMFFTRSRSASPEFLEPPAKRQRVGPTMSANSVLPRQSTLDNSGKATFLEE
jgi:hypothetical protein